MQLKIEGKTEHKGFLLKEPAVLNGNILVLTGRNGSGKTRLIESLQNQCSMISIGDEIVNTKDVRLVEQSSLNPSIGSNYNDAQFQTKITGSLQLYDRIKNDLNSPYDQNKSQQYNRMRDSGLDYESLFKLCMSISKTVNKSASELTHDDIILNFEEPLKNVLGMQNISTIFNQYIKRLNKNKYNEWLRTVKGEDVQYWSEEEFFNRFGERPWTIVNKILEDTFDGKFQFIIPDEKSQSYTYQTQLIQTDNHLLVSVEHLSSGEKTLLWLALTLFNSQYYDAEIAHAPKILLIDEPDAFLHPKMVLKMYQALESFKCNFNSIVLISTHSPTTVALAPSNEVFLVENDSISAVEKDSAIAQLLDGVTQISLNPKNRRQVFVESQYDADVYQAIYSKLVHKSNTIDPKISLSFVSSGPKMPKQQLIDKAKQVFDIKDEAILSEFVESINGIGNCVQVIGQVESLVENENNSVRGIIDWDRKNHPSRNVSVLAKDYAYSIENVTLDPVCILLLLHIEKPDIFTMVDVCGSDIHWSDWLKDLDILQESIDDYILCVLGRANKRDSSLRYISGIELFTDSEYLTKNGHDLERLVKEKYPGLNAFCKKGKDGELKYSIVNKSMLNLTKGDFIPSVFEKVLSEVQK
ncbi:AAA family ATPase [Shewanella sp. LZH-2]|uniref:AAA family ATPase n=1 Tax=Shewanella sp. LZH-2 TaxID=2806008 RepID=UPI00193D0FFC|nr:AAA family ATPase [Shewanella sp. LZH-2]QRK78212.1 ATP-binding protein [Shewanella sp. LZH-2]